MIQKPKSESVLEEIHRIRREISARFDGNIAAIAEDASKRQAASGRPMWPPKPAQSPQSVDDEARQNGE